MLKTASLQDITSRLITKRHGHLVMTSRFYPRNLKREVIHEYMSCLAPSKTLLTEFKTMAKKLGHDEAFKLVGYNRKFKLTAEGVEELMRLSELSREKDVYLICYCSHANFCHRDLLLLMAEALFEAKIEPVKRVYNGFDPRAAVPEV